MAVSFPRLPRWLCGGNTKDREKKESKGSSSSSLKKTKSASSSSSSTVSRMKRGWSGRGEEEKMGNVVFPKPDDPEWSIGWVEPHGPGFKCDDDNGGFVVLVPCYKKVMDGSGFQIPNGLLFPAPDGKKNMEQWLSSMGKL